MTAQQFINITILRGGLAYFLFMKKDKNKETTEEMGDNEVVFEEDGERVLSSIEQVKNFATN